MGRRQGPGRVLTPRRSRAGRRHVARPVVYQPPRDFSPRGGSHLGVPGRAREAGPDLSVSTSSSSSDRRVVEVHWRQCGGCGSRLWTPAWRSATSGAVRTPDWRVGPEVGASGWGVDFAKRTQPTRFLHNSADPTPLGQGRFCRTNPTRIGPPRFGSTTGAVGRSFLRNEPNPGTGPHPGGESIVPNEPDGHHPLVLLADCPPGPDSEVTRSVARVLGLPNPAIPCHHLGPRRSAARFCRPNPIPGDVRPRVSAIDQRPPARGGGRIYRTKPIRAGRTNPGRECRHQSGASATREEPGRSPARPGTPGLRKSSCKAVCSHGLRWSQKVVSPVRHSPAPSTIAIHSVWPGDRP
ncbi:MAG: hypothetical protein JWO38_3075 [Gemmataceae bacterium]|nr:hypothetical protein [Gemmataceae bacterium]